MKTLCKQFLVPVFLCGFSMAAHGQCPATTVNTSLPSPKLHPVKDGDASVSGTVATGHSGSVKICSAQAQLGMAAVNKETGAFEVAGLAPIARGQALQAQFVDGTTGAFGAAIPLTATAAQTDPIVILIGGIEYAGYSAQSQTTNGFLNVFYDGPPHWQRLKGWGRIRLTSTPQQATNGVVSVISNPTGLTTNDYSNVGQALDYVAGPSIQLAKGWSFIAGLGATTPLSSQSAPVTFMAPAPGTNECTELVNRFSKAQGYDPFLTLNTDPTPATCLAGGYTDIAFSNQDRSSFLLKYGGGFRTTYGWKFGDCKDNPDDSACPPAYSALDITFGQDASVTGGMLRGVVFKLDGVIPIRTKNSSWLYLFGSSYIRVQRNQTQAPLLLQTPSSPISVPSPTVFVLPLRQPNRDYYRLGVGLNISQLWASVFGSN